jgi:hypothetical protein
MRHFVLFPPRVFTCLANVRCLIYDPGAILWVQVMKLLIMRFSAFFFCVSCPCSKWCPNVCIFRYHWSFPFPKPRKFRIHAIRNVYFNLWLKQLRVTVKVSLTLNRDASMCFNFVASESVCCTVVLLSVRPELLRVQYEGWWWLWLIEVNTS